MRLVHGEDDGFADGPGWVFLRFLEKGFAHETIARGCENLPLQVLNLEVFILLVDDDRPAILRERLGGDIGAHVNNLGQTKKRAFGVFDGINNIVTVGRKSGFAPEVVVGVAKLPRFETLWVLGFQLFEVDVLQICLRCGCQTDARGLEKLNDLAGVAIN